MSLPAPLYALVIEQEKRVAKTGSFFWQNTLKVQGGNIKSLMWNANKNAESDPAFPHIGDIIEITGYDDQLAERGSIIIRGFNRATIDEVPKNMKSIVEFPKAPEGELKNAFKLIRDDSIWENKNNYVFTMACLDVFSQEILEKCPAATHIHHSYQGGFIIHTSEVFSIARAIHDISKKYSFINGDVINSSSILHDLGKLKTYFINKMGLAEQLVTEKTIGHIFYGMHIIQDVYNSGKFKVEESFVNEVLHCIASHHGDIKFGSVKEVQSIEAGIISKADAISSRNGIIENILNESKINNQPIQDSFKMFGDSYYLTSGMKRYLEI